MSDEMSDDRIRQAQIHKLMQSPVSLYDTSPIMQNEGHSRSDSPIDVDDLAVAEHSTPSHSSKKRGSKKQQQEKEKQVQQANANGPANNGNSNGNHNNNSNNPSSSSIPAPASLEPKSLDNNLHFQKEPIRVPNSSTVAPSSHLAQQLQLARSGLDESSFPRSASNVPHKFTVYLPHEEGSMVQISVPPNCTAHQLVKVALQCAKHENNGELPSGLIDDPLEYRVYVAEEDDETGQGEVDTDFPVCHDRMNICSIGAEAFILRDRVEAKTRPSSSSVVEGEGVDHSQSEHEDQRRRSTKTLKGFASLETETDGHPNQKQNQTKNKEDEQAACCGTGCTIQ